MHLHNCRCFQKHLRMLLQSLRALCEAPWGPGSIWKYLQALMRAAGVSGRFTCGFQPDLPFADDNPACYRNLGHYQYWTFHICGSSLPQHYPQVELWMLHIKVQSNWWDWQCYEQSMYNVSLRTVAHKHSEVVVNSHLRRWVSSRLVMVVESYDCHDVFQI